MTVQVTDTSGCEHTAAPAGTTAAGRRGSLAPPIGNTGALTTGFYTGITWSR